MEVKEYQYQDPDLGKDEALVDKLIRFFNCKLFCGSDEKTVQITDLWVRNGRVVDPKRVFYEEKKSADIIVNCNGLIIAPGFLDIQLNGAFGIDFSTIDCDFEDKLCAVSQKLLQYGVTGFCPTIVSSDPRVYKAIVPLIKKDANVSSVGARILGTHLEGPFISHEKSGCHPRNRIVSDFGDDVGSKIDSIYGYFDDRNVAIITIAPELPGALNAIKYLTTIKKVRVSVGHSNGSLDDGVKALESGATCVTHLFNAMPLFHHRKPGIIGLLTKSNYYDNLFYGIIADGVHTEKAALQIAHSTYPGGLVLVTDSISALGLNDGDFLLGDVKIRVKGMMATIADSNVVAGSVASMPHCIRVFAKSVGCKLSEAFKYASLNPARALGCEDRMGSFDYGSYADFVLLDENVNIFATFVGGVKRYMRR